MQELGFAVVAILGYPFLIAWLMGLSKASRIAELERRIEALNERVHRFTTPPSPVAPTWRPANAVPVAVPLPDLVRACPQAPAAEHTITSYPPQPETTVPEPESAIPANIDAIPTAQDEPVPDPYLEPSPRWLVAAKTWVLTGNLVAKLGLVILFIGVGFLLKYAAATFTIPLELRLAAVVLADFGLLAWGMASASDAQGARTANPGHGNRHPDAGDRQRLSTLCAGTLRSCVRAASFPYGVHLPAGGPAGGALAGGIRHHGRLRIARVAGERGRWKPYRTLHLLRAAQRRRVYLGLHAFVASAQHGESSPASA